MADDPFANYQPPSAPPAAKDDPFSNYQPPTQGGSAPAPAAPGQSWTDWALSNAKEAGKLAVRTGARVVEGPADLAQTVGHLADEAYINRFGPVTNPVALALEPGLAGHTATPPSLADEVIAKTGTQIAPDAGTAMKVADFIAPWLVPGVGGAAGRVGEAAGGLNKALEAGRFVAGAGADAGLTMLGGQLGQQYGGDTGGLLGSLAGGGLRPVAARTGGATLHAFGGAKDSGGIFDAMTSPQGPDAFPTFGQVAGDSGQRLEKAVGSLPGGNWTIDAARAAAQSGIQNSVNTGLSVLGGDPIRGPIDRDVTSARIGSQARAVNQQTQSKLSAEQQQLENAVGSGTTGSASPIVQTVTQLSQAPTTGVNISRSLDPRATDLQAQIARTTNPNPMPGAVGPPTPEITYGAAKDLRADLRDRAAAAPPLTGHYLDQTESAYTDFMRGVAQRTGQGDLFDAANQRYAQFKNTQQPWLESQGGALDAAPRVPATGVVSGIIGSGTGPQYLSDLATHISPEVASSTLADVLSRIGQQGKTFTPSAFGRDYGAVNDAAKGFIAQNAPAATPYLENAATGGRAFDVQPERPGLSKGLGWLYGAASMPGVSALTSANIESPALIRAVAGRADIPSILAQLALRQGLSAQSGQQQVNPY